MTENTTWPGWKQVRKLGSGSYGTVYEICREDDPSFHDALKVITIPQDDSEINSVRTEGLDDASVTSYFKEQAQSIISEIRMMDQVKGYTNIVSYQEHMVMQHKDGIGFDILIRMELLTPLVQYSVDHNLTVGDVRKMATDLLGALKVCETYHIVHRDIKPENIFINKTGDFKLGDFGIARRMEESIGTMSTKGTYNYMAPEVYRGLKGSKNVDIYSLGMVLYKYLNHGRLPFLPPAGQPIRPHDREDALTKRMSGEKIPAPAEGDDAFKKAVLKAIAFDPADRWQSAEEFMHALTGGYMAGGTTDQSLLNYSNRDSDRLDLDAADDSIKELSPIPERSKMIPDADDSGEKTIYTGSNKPSEDVNDRTTPKSTGSRKETSDNDLYKHLFPDDEQKKKPEPEPIDDDPEPESVKPDNGRVRMVAILVIILAVAACIIIVLVVKNRKQPAPKLTPSPSVTTSSSSVSEKKTPEPVNLYGLDFDLGLKDSQAVEKTGTQSQKELFPQKKTIRVGMDIDTSVKKSDGYEVTYNVTWNYKDNPKIQVKKASMEAAGKVVTPWPACAVFDYTTGKNLWSSDVTDPKWGETKYYGDQSYTTTDGKYLITVKYGKQDSITFRVKVPEKDAHIAVAFGVISDNESREFHRGFSYESDFSEYKNSSLYSKGDMSYMKLDSDTLSDK